MREIVYTPHFKSDLRKLGRSGRYDLKELLTAIEMLATGNPLPEKYLDHPLSGECRDHRDCHIRFDWLLLYRLQPGRLVLVRSGSHAELYE
jgi:mRNA interferase YafQ